MNWLSLDSNSFHLLAQTSQSPTPNDLELLRKQLDFITQSNKDLNESFKTFVEAMKFVLVVFGFLGAVLAFIFGKNLDDAKKVARDAIRQEVDSYVTTLVHAEIENVKRTLQRERIIGDTTVNYYLPHQTQPPREFKLLQARGFRDVRFPKDLQQLQTAVADVIVLDLENWLTTLPEAEQEAAAKDQIETLLNLLPRSAVLVVYVRSVVKYLYSVPRDRYITPVNNPVTLIGMVADAAYVVAGDRIR